LRKYAPPRGSREGSRRRNGDGELEGDAVVEVLVVLVLVVVVEDDEVAGAPPLVESVTAAMAGDEACDGCVMCAPECDGAALACFCALVPWSL